jgi:hypothetical protein
MNKVSLLTCCLLLPVNALAGESLLTQSAAPTLTASSGSSTSTTVLTCSHKVEAESCPSGYYAAGYVFVSPPIISTFICCKE